MVKNKFSVISVIVVLLLIGGLIYFFNNPPVTEQAFGQNVQGSILARQGTSGTSYICPDQTTGGATIGCEVRGKITCSQQIQTPFVKFRQTARTYGVYQNGDDIAVDTNADGVVDKVFRLESSSRSPCNFGGTSGSYMLNFLAFNNLPIYYSPSLDEVRICKPAESHTGYSWAFEEIMTYTDEFISGSPVPSYRDSNPTREIGGGQGTITHCEAPLVKNDVTILERLLIDCSTWNCGSTAKYSNWYQLQVYSGDNDRASISGATNNNIEFREYRNCNECTAGTSGCDSPTQKWTCTSQSNGCLSKVTSTVNAPETCSNGIISCASSYNGKNLCPSNQIGVNTCTNDGTAILTCQRSGSTNCYYRETTPQSQNICPQGQYCASGSCTSNIYYVNVSSNFRSGERIPIVIFTNVPSTPVNMKIYREGTTTIIDQKSIQTNSDLINTYFDGIEDAGTYIIEVTISYSSPSIPIVVTREIYINAPIEVDFQYNQIQYANKPITVIAQPRDADVDAVPNSYTATFNGQPVGVTKTIEGRDIKFTSTVSGSGTYIIKSKFQKANSQDISDLLTQTVEVRKPYLQIELIDLIPSSSIQEGLKTFKFKVLNNDAQAESDSFLRVKIRTPLGTESTVSTNQLTDSYTFSYDYVAEQGGFYTIRIIADKDGYTSADTGELTINVVKQCTGTSCGTIGGGGTQGGVSTPVLVGIIAGGVVGVGLIVFLAIKLTKRKK